MAAELRKARPQSRRQRGSRDPSARLRRVQELSTTAVNTRNELLAVAVGDPSPEVARAALRRLTESGGPSEGRALAEHLLGVDVAIVRDVARAISVLDARSGVDTALTGARDQSPHVRQAAAIALEVLRDRRARSALEALLDDAHASVRRAAVDALACLGTLPATTARISERLQDPDVTVRIASVGALARHASDPSAALLPAAADPQPRVRRALAAETRRLCDELAARLLGDGDRDVRVEALWQLVEAPRAALRLQIERLLTDASWQVRRAAARALGALGSKRSSEPLLKTLSDDHPTVRDAALRALREIYRGSVGIYLRHRIGDLGSDRIPSVLYALARIDSDSAEAAVSEHQLHGDPAPSVRIAAAHACDPVRSHRILASLAHDADADVRHAALSRLDGASG